MSGTSRLLVPAAFALLASTCAVSAGPVSYQLRRFPAAPVHVISVDLTSNLVSIQPQLAGGGLGRSEPFRAMLRRTRPVAAITGAFFDTRSKYPVGDIAIGGRVVHHGCVGNGICVTEQGQVKFVRRSEGVATGWKGYQAVLCGGPTLLRDGRMAVWPSSEGFHDSGIAGKHRRTAAGLTADNHLLLVSCNKAVSLRRLAMMMQEMGCREAMTLDGGTSTALWYNGKLLSTPGRHLTNLLAVHVSAPVETITTALAVTPEIIATTPVISAR